MKKFFKMARPFGIGCQPKPKEGTFVTVEDGHPLANNWRDVISYEHELTLDQMREFELEEIEQREDGTWKVKR